MSLYTRICLCKYCSLFKQLFNIIFLNLAVTLFTILKTVIFNLTFLTLSAKAKLSHIGDR